MQNAPVERGAQLWGVFVTPLDRIWSAKSIALTTGVVDYLLTDAFGGAIALAFLSGIWDYRTSIKAAKLLGKFDTAAAQRAWLGKTTGLSLAILVRALEFYIQGQGFDTHGAAATAIALSLFAVDLETTSHCREQMGLPPIPVLGRILKWVRDLADSKVPPAPPPPSGASQ